MTFKRTVILFPAAFLMNMSIMMINFAVIFFLKDLVGLTASTIGWFFAAGSGGYVLGCILLRPVQNRMIPPVSMFISIIMTIFSLFMIKNSTSPGAVLVYYLIFSTAPAFYWPQLMGWFSYGLKNDELGKSISKFNISWSTGALTGPLVGGILAERNIIMSFYIDIAMIAAIAILLMLGLVFIRDMRTFPSHLTAAASGPATHEAGLEEKPAKQADLINGGRGTIMRFSGWIGVYSAYIVLGLINNIFPLFVRDSLGLGESLAGNILFIRGVTSAIGFYLAGRFIRWHFNRKIMILTQVAVIAVLLVMMFIKTIPGFYLLFIIFGFLFAMAYSNGIFHGSAGALDRGRRMGLFESFLTLGLITGSIGGGYLYQYFSIYAAFIFSAAIIAAGLSAQLIIFAIGKRRQIQ